MTMSQSYQVHIEKNSSNELGAIPNYIRLTTYSHYTHLTKYIRTSVPSYANINKMLLNQKVRFESALNAVIPYKYH